MILGSAPTHGRSRSVCTVNTTVVQTHNIFILTDSSKTNDTFCYITLFVLDLCSVSSSKEKKRNKGFRRWVSFFPFSLLFFAVPVKQVSNSAPCEDDWKQPEDRDPYKRQSS
ncbi:hypothetical protein GOODEAATRI_014386 [Goodea atripinnis]|uniref:Uncharacterized protein n=1 Tax=Goodea atripinnis TaxID=208336 RepID=A0ABV0NK89_9TELE